MLCLGVWRGLEPRLDARGVPLKAIGARREFACRFFDRSENAAAVHRMEGLGFPCRHSTAKRVGHLIRDAGALLDLFDRAPKSGYRLLLWLRHRDLRGGSVLLVQVH